MPRMLRDDQVDQLIDDLDLGDGSAAVRPSVDEDDPVIDEYRGELLELDEDDAFEALASTPYLRAKRPVFEDEDGLTGFLDKHYSY